MIMEVNNILGLEDAVEADAVNTALVRSLLATHLPSAIARPTKEPQDLSVGVVAAQMFVDALLREPMVSEIRLLAKRLAQVDERLPDDLSQHGVRVLFEQLGISTSERFRTLFRETAILLTLGKGQAQLAAARRQKRTHSQGERLVGGNGS
jgi:hypothetical protein